MFASITTFYVFLLSDDHTHTQQTLNHFQSQSVLEGKQNTGNDFLYVRALTVSLLTSVFGSKPELSLTLAVNAFFSQSGLLYSGFWRGTGYRRFEAMSVLEDGNWISRNVSNLCRVTSQKDKDPTKLHGSGSLKSLMATF
jgi:hypothetical protein